MAAGSSARGACPARRLAGAALLALMATLATIALAPAAWAQTKWRHGLLQPRADAGFFFMPEEKGFWRKHGLDVQIIEMRSERQMVRALVQGEIDSADTPAPAVLSAMELGADLRFVGATMPGLPYVLYVRTDVTDWAALRGKTFGISTPGAVPDVIARTMLQRKGVPPSSIKTTTAGGSAARIQALAGGRIDATAGSSEYLPDAPKLGLRILGFASDLVPEYPRYVLAAKADTAKQRRETLAAFLAGYVEGLDYALAHRDETIRLASRRNNRPEADPHFSSTFDEAKARGYVAVAGELPRQKLEWLQDELVRQGELKKRLDLDRFIDDGPRQDALKRVTR